MISMISKIKRDSKTMSIKKWLPEFKKLQRSTLAITKSQTASAIKNSKTLSHNSISLIGSKTKLKRMRIVKINTWNGHLRKSSDMIFNNLNLDS